MSQHIETTCLYGNNIDLKVDNSGAISFPIYQSATFAHPEVGKSTNYDYSRLQNPTRQQLENVVASLEKGFDAIAFSSGMAAISALMEIFSPGDHIICSNDLYGGSTRIFNNISSKNKIEFDYIDTSDVNDVCKLIKPNTKAIYIETPSNPMMQVTNIHQISIIAKEKKLLLIVDNTFLSPYFQNPLELGADIVVHSGTKFLGGHNDTIAGFLIVANKYLSDKLRFIIKTIGNGLSPFDSWLILRGIKTLAIRMEAQQANAIKIANWLNSHKKVTKVFYLGLENHPGYEVNKKQSRGFGSMISFRVDSPSTAVNLLNNLKVIHFAESLGGVETLLTYPMLQTHSDVPEEDRETLGITDTLLRISVGIEHIDDIIKDLNSGLEV